MLQHEGNAAAAAALVLLLLAAPGGCFSLREAADGGEEAAAGVQARFLLPRPGRGEGFFDLPWPGELRRLPDGRPDLRFYPNPGADPVLSGFTVVAANLIEGFGLSPAITFTFDGPVAPAGLPASAEASLAPGSALFLVDVDPASPAAERGRRLPVEWRWQEAASGFHPAHTLTLRPVFGFVLRENTLYAAGITRALAGADGHPVAPADDLRRLLAGEEIPGVQPDTLDAARRAYAPLLAQLAATPELPPAGELVAATVFRTGQPTARTFTARGWVLNRPAPAPEPCVAAEDELPGGNVGADAFDLYRGAVATPQYQTGTPPYAALGSGEVDGAVNRTERVVFHLTVPKGAPPAQGFPVVLYAHGTGGDSLSFVLSGVPAGGGDGLAAALARAGLATLGFELAFHGSRNPGGPGADPSELVYNWQNPVAGRDNVVQTGLELIWFVRVLQTLADGPGAYFPAGRTVQLDAARIVFCGHSQGSQGGSLLLAAEPAVLGGVLTGAGGGFAISLLQKTKPRNVMAEVEQSMHLAPGELDLFHPLVDLIQGFTEAGDPLVYARSFFAEPHEGGARSVLLVEGLKDEHSPPMTTEALAVAGLLPQVGAVARPVPGLALRGLGQALAPPAVDDVGAAGKKATAGLVQYPDGDHFVSMTDPAARHRMVTFLQHLATDGKGWIE